MVVTASSNGVLVHGEQGQPRIVIDVSNVCMFERDHLGRPRLSNLLSARALLRKLGYETTLICDANLKYSIDDEAGFQQLEARGELRQAPAGTDGDVWILEAAAAVGARVLSNDTYRTYQGRFPWIVERRVSFMVIDGEVLIPDLATSPVRPLRGEDRIADATDTQVPTPVSAGDRQRSLVYGLVAENEALRTQREQLLRECDDLRARTETALTTAAEATDTCTAVRAEMAALQVRQFELDASLSDAETQLAAERQRSAAAVAEQQRQELSAIELREKEVTLSAKVSTLERALGAMRPDAQLEQKVDRLLRDLHRVLKSQSEPINNTLQQAVETRKAVVAMQTDTHALAQHAEAISRYLERRGDLEAAEPEDAPTTGETWSARYPRIERAWLANKQVGDQSEAAAFLNVVRALRRVDKSLNDDRLLADLDALAAHVGKNFSYTVLWHAVGKTHSPSLGSGVLLTRTREAARAVGNARAREHREPAAVSPVSADADSTEPTG